VYILFFRQGFNGVVEHNESKAVIDEVLQGVPTGTERKLAFVDECDLARLIDWVLI